MPSLAFTLAGLGAVAVLARWYFGQRELSAIPTIGYSDPILSFISAFRFLTDGKRMLGEGYEKYKPGIFKIPNFDGWVVVAAGSQYMDDLRKAPDDVLSFDEAINRRQQVKHTIGHEHTGSQYHVAVIKSQLTRNIGYLFKDIRDEVVAAFADSVSVKDDGQWVKVGARSMLQNVVCRVSNRLFVGVPLCRNPDWVDLNINFTIDAALGAQKIRVFPDWMKPTMAKLLTNVPRNIDRSVRHLKPIIEDRQKMMAEHGDSWEDRPSDFLQWLLEEELGKGKSIREHSQRVLSVNFAAIHTSSTSMLQALYHLAANPEYAEPMREEVEAIIAADGWSKAAMGKMRKVDSFLKETQRMEGIGLLAMTRYSLKPFTFSNGVHIPAGVYVAGDQYNTHHDGELYENAEVFNPWRFSSMRDDGESTKHQLVATSNEFVNFGHGRHACPGRFFAANELKAMLAHIVLNYDVKFENEHTEYPPNMHINGNVIPANVDVLFRKRQS